MRRRPSCKRSPPWRRRERQNAPPSGSGAAKRKPAQKKWRAADRRLAGVHWPSTGVVTDRVRHAGRNEDHVVPALDGRLALDLHRALAFEHVVDLLLQL